MIKIHDLRWNQRSLSSVTANFKPTPWACALAKVCQKFKVEEEKVTEDSKFLGHGADGYVFKVTIADHIGAYALKISTKSMRNSHAILNKLAEKGVTCVPKVVGDVETATEGELEVESMLSTPVLQSVASIKRCLTEEHVKALFTSLASIHKAGYLHRDPRLANFGWVTKNNSDFYWIDFVRARALDNDAEVLHDFNIVCDDLKKYEMWCPDNIESKLEAYLQDKKFDCSVFWNDED